MVEGDNRLLNKSFPLTSTCVLWHVHVQREWGGGEDDELNQVRNIVKEKPEEQG